MHFKTYRNGKESWDDYLVIDLATKIKEEKYDVSN